MASRTTIISTSGTSTTRSWSILTLARSTQFGTCASFPTPSPPPTPTVPPPTRLANPRLRAQLVSGNPVYTSMVHGSRVYQCETSHGIRVYDFSDPTNLREVGFVPLPHKPRHLILKDGKGYCCPGAAKLVVFDATTLAIEHTYPMAGAADFAHPIGNMAI